MYRFASRFVALWILFCVFTVGNLAQDDVPAITPDNADQVTLLSTFWQRLDEYHPYYAPLITWHFSNTGQWLVSKHHSCQILGHFQIWNLATLRMETQLERSPYACRGEHTDIQFSADDQYFSARQCNYKNCGFQVWNLSNADTVYSEIVDEFSQDGVATLSSGMLAVTFVENTSIQLYDVLQDGRANIFQSRGADGWRPKFIATNADETIMAVQDSGIITLLQMPEGTIIGTIELPKRIRTDMRFTDDSRYLILERYYSAPKTFWMNRLGEVIKWDIEAGEIASQYELNPERTYTLTVSKNADYLLLREGNHVELINMASGEIIATYDDERIQCLEIASYHCARISDDGNLVAWIGDDTIRIANFDDGSLVSKLPIGPRLRDTGFIPNTSIFVTIEPTDQAERRGYPACNIQLWDATTGQTIGSALVGLCDYFAISPDGTTIITADNQTAMIFGVPSQTRQAFSSVPAFVQASAITVRTEPNSDADIIGYLSGATVVGGFDPSGRYLYIPNSDGWVRSDPGFIDMNPFASLQQIPMRPEQP